MVIRTINVRHKGQMTLPADVREELGVKNGGTLLLERRRGEWVLIQPEDLVDQLAGSLSEYATNEPLEWDREELWTEIATERDNRVLEQLRDQEHE